MDEKPPVVNLPAGAGRVIELGPGAPFIFKLNAAETSGRFTLVEMLVPVGQGPPPHIHEGFDESFYVLEGSIIFIAGENELRTAAGDFLHVPHGVAHGFRNLDTGVARVLVIVSPGGYEQYFIDLAEAVAAMPAGAPADYEVLAGIMGRYGVRFAPSAAGPQSG